MTKFRQQYKQNPPMFMLICPAIFELPWANIVSTQIDDKPATAKMLAKIKSYNQAFTEMDFRTTLDVILLHELFHTAAIMPVCAQTENPCPAWKMPFGKGRKFGGAFDTAEGYWAATLAAPDPLHNAHSLAQLANMAMLISDKRLSVRQDGSLFKI
ncbi:hypothetical protein BGZ63DRAFT_249825 [Mariannaea sp. PMI_226]|nr:hypothetical protein BGZ63DRAFT_249825 [Mariannaea sp. PMI_226]